MDNAIKILIYAILAPIIFLVLFVPTVVLGGVILQDAWDWFIVPLGVAPVGLVHAIGLAMLVGHFKMDARKAQEKDEHPLRTLAITIGAMLLSWGLMAIVASFM